MKYIIVKPKNFERGFESAIVFDESLVHREVAKGIGRTHCVVSAGFCHRDRTTGEFSVTGESESLRLKSRPQDLSILKFQIDPGISALDKENQLVLAVLSQEDDDSEKLSRPPVKLFTTKMVPHETWSFGLDAEDLSELKQWRPENLNCDEEIREMAAGKDFVSTLSFVESVKLKNPEFLVRMCFVTEMFQANSIMPVGKH